MTLQMNFHLRPYNQYILNIVTNIYLGLDYFHNDVVLYKRRIQVFDEDDLLLLVMILEILGLF